MRVGLQRLLSLLLVNFVDHGLEPLDRVVLWGPGLGFGIKFVFDV